MDIKKIVLISLIALAIVASVSAVSAGIFDNVFLDDTNNNVIEMGNITFNASNVTSFELFNENEVASGIYSSCYVDENDTGYTINILNCSELNESAFKDLFDKYMEDFEDSPTQTIKGIVVYTTSANYGDHAGEPRFVAYVENNESQTIVDISTPDAKDTAKIASTLEFK